jgi:hypothetical protein
MEKVGNERNERCMRCSGNISWMLGSATAAFRYGVEVELIVM